MKIQANSLENLWNRDRERVQKYRANVKFSY